MAVLKANKITPFLWYNIDLEEVVNFYVSIFKNSLIIQKNSMMATFELEGQRFLALNGGPEFKFTDAVSFFISCKNQDEVDYYWNELLKDGGVEVQCGWLKDKYGLSWQVVPEILGELLSDPDPVKSDKVMKAMLKMVKLDIDGLINAIK